MSPAVARPLLHTAHLLTFVVVFGTGVLLFVPALREVITGGYSLLIRETHVWGGVVFGAAPVVVIAVAGVGNVFVPPATRTLRSYWQGAHVAITVLTSTVLTITGFVLWAKRAVPDSILEPSRAVHDGLTYVVAVLVALHLCEVGLAAVITRIRSATAPAHPSM
jgi:cytochrome b subunit of formate dehydrogenase